MRRRDSEPEVQADMPELPPNRADVLWVNMNLEPLRKLAQANGHGFHLAAAGGNTVGINRTANSAKFPRKAKDGTRIFSVHAELDLLLELQRTGKRVPKKITVVRFLKNGELSMSRPCLGCRKYLRAAGVEQVKYSDWNGNFKQETL